MKCQCAGCGEVFGGESLFNRHRTGEYALTPPNYGRRCLTRQEMKAKGWVVNSRGHWVAETWDKVYRLPFCRSYTGGDLGDLMSEDGGGKVGCEDDHSSEGAACS